MLKVEDQIRVHHCFTSFLVIDDCLLGLLSWTYFGHVRHNRDIEKLAPDLRHRHENGPPSIFAATSA